MAEFSASGRIDRPRASRRTMKPVLALVGRPNVGKSTLFNRLTKSRDAIVANFAGLTRDRHYGQGRHGNREYIVVDTGGFEPEAESGIVKEMGQTLVDGVADAFHVENFADLKEVQQSRVKPDRQQGQFTRPIFNCDFTCQMGHLRHLFSFTKFTHTKTVCRLLLFTKTLNKMLKTVCRLLFLTKTLEVHVKQGLS